MKQRPQSDVVDVETVQTEIRSYPVCLSRTGLLLPVLLHYILVAQISILADPLCSSSPSLTRPAAESKRLLNGPDTADGNMLVAMSTLSEAHSHVNRPTGSILKDRGMTFGISGALWTGPLR